MKKEFGWYVIVGCGGLIVFFMNMFKDISGLSVVIFMFGIVLMVVGLFFGVWVIYYFLEIYQDFVDDWVDYENEVFVLMFEVVQGN